MPCIDQCYYFIQITMVFVISLCRRFHGKSEICHMTKRSKKCSRKSNEKKKLRPIGTEQPNKNTIINLDHAQQNIDGKKVSHDLFIYSNTNG